jgi:hypothetical protein
MARKTQSPASNARAGATTEPRELALRKWIDAIASGVTERGAAVEITAEFGFSHGQLVGWCRYDPEGWGKALAAAHAAKVERLESDLRAIALGEVVEDPSVAKVRASTLQWLLSKWDRDSYGDQRRVEQTVALVPPPPEDTPEAIAEDALSMLTAEQRAALLRRLGEGS